MPDVIRFCERVFYLLLAAGVIIRFIPVLSVHPQVVVYMISELASVFFIIIQRKGTWSSGAYATAIAFVGTSAPLLVKPVGAALAPDWLSAAIMIVGASISIGGKLSLRRSFGLIAANRGVKTKGLYRFVRHPIYFGYIVSEVGLLLLYFSIWNVASIAFGWVMLWLRAREEEKFLSKDPEYRAYAQRVSGRLIPRLL